MRYFTTWNERNNNFVKWNGIFLFVFLSPLLIKGTKMEKILSTLSTVIRKINRIHQDIMLKSLFAFLRRLLWLTKQTEMQNEFHLPAKCRLEDKKVKDNWVRCRSLLRRRLVHKLERFVREGWERCVKSLMISLTRGTMWLLAILVVGEIMPLLLPHSQPPALT